MTTYFVSRHPGSQHWSQQHNLHIDHYISHLEDTQIIQSGDIIIGTLPVNLAEEICARGGRYIHLSLILPFEARGKELSSDDLEKFHATLQEYVILKQHD